MLHVILGDIHGNLEAFEAVIRSFPSGREYDINCAGDIVGYGADPAACVDRILSLRAGCVLGNHDAAAVGRVDTGSFNKYAKEAARWTKGILAGTAKDFLKNLRYVVDAGGFTVVHGTLHDAEAFHYMMTGVQAMKTFEVMENDLCFVGHLHVPGIFSLRDGKVLYSYRRLTRLREDTRYIVNVGSVGQPRDNDNRACYCVYDDSKKEIELKRVAYDIHLAQEKILACGLPSRLAERLSLGI